MRSHNPDSVSFRRERFNEDERRVGRWLATPVWRHKPGGDEMTEQDEQWCPCGACSYDADDGVWIWSARGYFVIHCPSECGCRLRTDGSIGPSVEQTEAQVLVLAERLGEGKYDCPNSIEGGDEWDGCPLDDRTDQRDECRHNARQHTTCWLLWSTQEAAKKAEVNDE